MQKIMGLKIIEVDNLNQIPTLLDETMSENPITIFQK